MRAPYREHISWYPFGARPYSRIELTVDALMHLLGTLLTLAAIVFTICVWPSGSPAILRLSVGVYLLSLLGMFLCSATYNIGLGQYGKDNYHLLSSLDLCGICLLIAGTNTPVMAVACCMRTLLFIWALASLTIATKCHGGMLNTLKLHVPCFLLMGWSCLIVWGVPYLHACPLRRFPCHSTLRTPCVSGEVMATFSGRAIYLFLAGGAIYTIGLIPWGMYHLEFHVCIWHAFVIAASSCFFAALIVIDLSLMPQKIISCMAVSEPLQL